MSHPEGWRTITLGEILTNEQCAEALKIINESQDTLEAHNKLRAYLVGIKDQLESKGIDPSYLAYALPYWIKHPHPPKPPE